MSFRLVEWLLPAVFVFAAAECHINSRENYRRYVKPRPTNDIGFLMQNWPGSKERIELAVNFPPLVLNLPFDSIDYAKYKTDSFPSCVVYRPPYGLEITIREVTFFCFVAGFWWWIGRSLDGFLRRRHVVRTRFMRLASAGLGFAFGLATLTYGVALMAIRYHSWRQIGIGGPVWGVLLTFYFAQSLPRARCGVGMTARRVALALLVVLAGVAAVDGGRTLRCLLTRETVEMPLSFDCAPVAEAPSAELVRIVAAQRAYYGLDVQRVKVCLATGPVSVAAPAGWRPLYVGCCTYSSGEHFAILAAAGGVVVNASAVQTRCACLRSAWRDWVGASVLAASPGDVVRRPAGCAVVGGRTSQD